MHSGNQPEFSEECHGLIRQSQYIDDNEFVGVRFRPTALVDQVRYRNHHLYHVIVFCIEIILDNMSPRADCFLLVFMFNVAVFLGCSLFSGK